MAAALHIQGQRHDRIPPPPGNGDLDQPSSPSLSARPVEGETSITQKMLSAVTGSVLTSLLVTPLDVVRVRLQAQSSPSPSSASRLPSFLHLPPNLGVTSCCREVFWVQNQSQFCVAAPATLSTASASVSASAAIEESAIISDCAAAESQRRTFNSTLDGIRKIAKNEGVFTLWRGLSPTLMMAVPGNVIYFAGYDWLRTSPISPMAHRVPDAYAPLAAGSVARVLAAVVVSPIEMLRTRMQASSSRDKGIMRETTRVMQSMVSNEGYTSLWRGFALTLWRDVPFSALYWWGYEFGRQRLDEARTRSSGSLANQRHAELSSSALLTDSFLAGATSGAVSAFVTTPFDVGKTRQQTGNAPERGSMPRFLWQIYRNEGWPGLFKGWAARCMKVAPACAIMISTYEMGKRMAAGGAMDREENWDQWVED